MLDLGINKIIIRRLIEYDPVRIGVFGSYANLENRSDSDLDILIELRKTISLFQLARLERELSESIGIKVDFVLSGAIRNES